MAVALWLAAYLLARSFPSRITLRAVVILLVLAASFFISYLNLYQPISRIAVKSALLLTIALMAWYDLTYQLLSPPARDKTRWVAWGVYAGSLIKIALLLGLRHILPDNTGTALWISPIETLEGNAMLLVISDGVFRVLTSVAILHNFKLGSQLRGGPHSQSTWIASLLGACSVNYGVLGLVATFPIPKVIQDSFLVAAIVALGYAVAVHQALVERRTTLRDFPVSGLTIFGLVGVYVVIAARQNVSPAGIAMIALLAVLTHSIYDIVREFLDRLLHRHESELRRQFRRLAREVSGLSKLQPDLQRGLSNLCGALDASNGFIAIRQEDKFVVSASLRSLPLGNSLEAADVTCEEPCPCRRAALTEKVEWLAPAFASGEQKAVIALGPRLPGGQYSETDLDLLAEMADWVGMLILAHAQQSQSEKQLMQLGERVRTHERNRQAATEELLNVFQNQPSPEFVRWVEEALKNLSDYTSLAESPLIVELGVVRSPYIESAKALREKLIQAIETLRPSGNRPRDLSPREWHSYIVLYDAYIEDVPNREIMARLYISEGTFNRQRRKALNAVARALMEMKSKVSTNADLLLRERA
jgi:hypothetical protein